MKPKKILVFSDFDSIRGIIVRALVNKNYEVIEANSYPDAIAQLNGTSFSLVITDNDVKNHDGIKLLNQMRDTTSYLFTPIILMHSSNTEQLKEELSDLNIACYLNKPFDMQNFFTIVERLA
jgi:DNA-binding NtrC family response regulator